MIIDAVTESGSRYRIDLERQFWWKFNRDGLRTDTERLWSLKVGTVLSTPWDSPSEWEDAEAPVVGKHLFVTSRDRWYVSTPILEIIEVPS